MSSPSFKSFYTNKHRNEPIHPGWPHLKTHPHHPRGHTSKHTHTIQEATPQNTPTPSKRPHLKSPQRPPPQPPPHHALTLDGVIKVSPESPTSLLRTSTTFLKLSWTRRKKKMLCETFVHPKWETLYIRDTPPRKDTCL
jgi:hypothetical protein